jgi:hypothetical protein
MTSNPSWPERSRFYMGVDLGQSSDPTAIAVVKRIEYDTGGLVNKPSIFQCGFLERAPLRTPYPAIVHRVGGLLKHPTVAGNVELAIDQTGVGGPVADMFKAAGFEFSGVVITGGNAETNPEPNVFHVPKLKLVSHLQALLHEGRLQIQKGLAEAETLVRELQDFRVRYSDNGYMTFNAREGKHDDLVLALAIAVWKAMRPVTGAEAMLEFYRRQVEEPWRFKGSIDVDDVRISSSKGWNFSSEPLFPVAVPEIIAAEGRVNGRSLIRIGNQAICEMTRAEAREWMRHPVWAQLNASLAEELLKEDIP